MKILQIILFLFFSIAPVTSNAQSTVIGKTKDYIAAGNARNLSNFFSKQIDISLDGEKSSYSKSQGEMVIKNFFRKNQPVSFEYIHRGSSKGNMKFVVGRLKSNKSQPFRIQILFKETQSGYLIESLQINKE